VITSYPTEDLTKIELTELLQKKLDALVNDLNKVNEQIDKITGHTDPSAKTVLERLKVKREKIQEDIFNLKYALKDSND
jgi:peptidoglycan hydrolase CwlO-like protein